MKMSDFKYNLPEERIAKFPPDKRGNTRLLVLDRKTGGIVHEKYSHCIKYLNKGDVIVLNETKVEKRRAFFLDKKERDHEVLFLNPQDSNWLCLIRKSKYISEGDILKNKDDDNIQIKIIKKFENGILVKIQSEYRAKEIFEKVGHTPIPPYMKRLDEKNDYKRYNTVFSNVTGSVAAPTASLNLTEDTLKRIEEKGVDIVKVELKVGWGTFAPIREVDIEEHKIHEEEISLSEESAEKINTAIREGGEVWAFGTTVARLLESCATVEGFVQQFKGYTNLYIYPGYKWKVVKHLVTNFHMPDSSLILLVSSFAGKELIKKAYKEALDKGYMFLSYGDSMLII